MLIDLFGIGAVIGLRPVRTAVREGEGNARVNVSVLTGAIISEPVLVRILTTNINATGK